MMILLMIFGSFKKSSKDFPSTFSGNWFFGGFCLLFIYFSFTFEEAFLSYFAPICYFENNKMG